MSADVSCRRPGSAASVIRRLQSPAVVACGTWLLALLALGAALADGTEISSLHPSSPGILVLVLSMDAAIVVAYLFPIYIRHNTKICVFSIPVFLLTVFLAPPFAAASAGLGILL